MNITKEDLEKWFNRVFDYEESKEYFSFKTDEDSDDFYEVIFGDDFLEIPNGSCGGGYVIDVGSCKEAGKEFSLETAEDVYTYVANCGGEEDGWVCI